MKLRNLCLLFILILAFALRIYHIGLNPPGLYWDEVSIGYNAWSIAKTGADEYGKKLPIFFEAFQEYKLPGYVYSLVPWVTLFGPNSLSVRLPSVLYGLGAVFLLYLISLRLFKSKVALLSSLLLATSPWHIQFSRTGFEANAALTVFLAGLYFLISDLKKSRWSLWGILFISCSVYFYNAYRVTVPLFLIFVWFLYRKIPFSKKQILCLIVIILLTWFPLISTSSSQSPLNRLSQVSVIGNPDLLSKWVNSHPVQPKNVIERILNHRYLMYTETITTNYLNNFAPSFFLGGDGNSRHSVSQVGLIGPLSLILAVVGWLVLIKRKNSFRWLITGWILISPIPSAISLPSPHALRSLGLVWAVLLVAAYGLVFLIQSFQNYFSHALICLGVSAIFIYSLYFYLSRYYFIYPTESYSKWAFEYEEVFRKISSYGNYSNVYISGKYWRPYIFALFYLRFPPTEYQKNPSHNHFGNMYFGYADYDSSDPYYHYNEMTDILTKLRKESDNLLILTPEEVIETDSTIDTIKGLDGKPVINVIRTQSK